MNKDENPVLFLLWSYGYWLKKIIKNQPKEGTCTIPATERQ